MGVQKFIYTISSEGALKSLRARSFYLELATEEVVQQILTALNLPRTNVIYAGASKFYLLVAATNQLEKKLQEIQQDFNDWLLETFQRKVFLAIACEAFSADQLEASPNSDQTPLAQIWQRVNDKLNAQASRKFAHQLDKILEPQPSHQPCKVCHRDDVPADKLKPLNEFEDDSVLVCCTCRRMFCIEGAKFPLYQAAKGAGDAEDAAKDNGRDSLSLFGETFKWEQWLGKRRGSHPIDAASRDYLQNEIVPELQGVLPFMQDLLNPQTLEFSYPQSFIRNLLITAQLREQKIKETQKLQPAQVKDVTYYLHLPKLAYALSRLPKSLQDQETFKPIRQSLLSPRNSPYFRAIATWIELLTRSNQG